MSEFRQPRRGRDPPRPSVTRRRVCYSAEPFSWKTRAMRSPRDSCGVFCATAACSCAERGAPGAAASCQAGASDDNACSSDSLRPPGWLSLNVGSEATLAKTGLSTFHAKPGAEYDWKTRSGKPSGLAFRHTEGAWSNVGLLFFVRSFPPLNAL